MANVTITIDLENQTDEGFQKITRDLTALATKSDQVADSTHNKRIENDKRYVASRKNTEKAISEAVKRETEKVRAANNRFFAEQKQAERRFQRDLERGQAGDIDKYDIGRSEAIAAADRKYQQARLQSERTLAELVVQEGKNMAAAREAANKRIAASDKTTSDAAVNQARNVAKVQDGFDEAAHNKTKQLYEQRDAREEESLQKKIRDLTTAATKSEQIQDATLKKSLENDKKYLAARKKTEQAIAEAVRQERDKVRGAETRAGIDSQRAEEDYYQEKRQSPRSFDETAQDRIRKDKIAEAQKTFENEREASEKRLSNLVEQESKNMAAAREAANKRIASSDKQTSDAAVNQTKKLSKETQRVADILRNRIDKEGTAYDFDQEKTVQDLTQLASKSQELNDQTLAKRIASDKEYLNSRRKTEQAITEVVKQEAKKIGGAQTGAAGIYQNAEEDYYQKKRQYPRSFDETAEDKIRQEKFAEANKVIQDQREASEKRIADIVEQQAKNMAAAREAANKRIAASDKQTSDAAIQQAKNVTKVVENQAKQTTTQKPIIPDDKIPKLPPLVAIDAARQSAEQIEQVRRNLTELATKDERTFDESNLKRLRSDENYNKARTDIEKDITAAVAKEVSEAQEIYESGNKKREQADKNYERRRHAAEKKIRETRRESQEQLEQLAKSSVRNRLGKDGPIYQRAIETEAVKVARVTQEQNDKIADALQKRNNIREQTQRTYEEFVEGSEARLQNSVVAGSRKLANASQKVLDAAKQQAQETSKAAQQTGTLAEKANQVVAAAQKQAAQTADVANQSNKAANSAKNQAQQTAKVVAQSKAATAAVKEQAAETAKAATQATQVAAAGSPAAPSGGPGNELPDDGDYEDDLRAIFEAEAATKKQAKETTKAANESKKATKNNKEQAAQTSKVADASEDAANAAKEQAERNAQLAEESKKVSAALRAQAQQTQQTATETKKAADQTKKAAAQTNAAFDSPENQRLDYTDQLKLANEATQDLAKNAKVAQRELSSMFRTQDYSKSENLDATASRIQHGSPTDAQSAATIANRLAQQSFNLKGLDAAQIGLIESDYRDLASRVVLENEKANEARLADDALYINAKKRTEHAIADSIATELANGIKAAKAANVQRKAADENYAQAKIDSERRIDAFVQKEIDKLDSLARKSTSKKLEDDEKYQNAKIDSERRINATIEAEENKVLQAQQRRNKHRREQAQAYEKYKEESEYRIGKIITKQNRALEIAQAQADARRKSTAEKLEKDLAKEKVAAARAQGLAERQALRIFRQEHLQIFFAMQTIGFEIDRLGQLLLDLTRRFVESAAQIETFTQSIKTVTQSGRETAKIVRSLLDVTIELVGIDTGTLFQFSARLQTAGLTAKQAERSISAVTKRMAEQGKSSDSTRRVLEQVTQAINSNTISMQDFRPILREYPLLYKDFSAALGVTVKNLQQVRDAANDVGGPTQAIVKTLGYISNIAVGANLETINAQLDNLQDRAFVLRSEIGEQLRPIIIELLKALSAVTDAFIGTNDIVKTFIATTIALGAVFGKTLGAISNIAIIGLASLQFGEAIKSLASITQQVTLVSNVLNKSQVDVNAFETKVKSTVFSAKNLTKALTGLGIAFGALAIAVPVVTLLYKEFTKASREAREAQERFTGDIIATTELIVSKPDPKRFQARSSEFFQYIQDQKKELDKLLPTSQRHLLDDIRKYQDAINKGFNPNFVNPSDRSEIFGKAHSAVRRFFSPTEIQRIATFSQAAERATRQLIVLDGLATKPIDTSTVDALRPLLAAAAQQERLLGNEANVKRIIQTYYELVEAAKAVDVKPLRDIDKELIKIGFTIRGLEDNLRNLSTVPSLNFTLSQLRGALDQEAQDKIAEVNRDEDDEKKRKLKIFEIEQQLAFDKESLLLSTAKRARDINKDEFNARLKLYDEFVSTANTIIGKSKSFSDIVDEDNLDNLRSRARELQDYIQEQSFERDQVIGQRRQLDPTSKDAATQNLISDFTSQVYKFNQDIDKAQEQINILYTIINNPNSKEGINQLAESLGRVSKEARNIGDQATVSEIRQIIKALAKLLLTSSLTADELLEINKAIADTSIHLGRLGDRLSNEQSALGVEVIKKALIAELEAQAKRERAIARQIEDEHERALKLHNIESQLARDIEKVREQASAKLIEIARAQFELEQTISKERLQLIRNILPEYIKLDSAIESLSTNELKRLSNLALAFDKTTKSIADLISKVDESKDIYDVFTRDLDPTRRTPFKSPSALVEPGEEPLSSGLPQIPRGLRDRSPDERLREKAYGEQFGDRLEQLKKEERLLEESLKKQLDYYKQFVNLVSNTFIDLALNREKSLRKVAVQFIKTGLRIIISATIDAEIQKRIDDALTAHKISNIKKIAAARQVANTASIAGDAATGAATGAGGIGSKIGKIGSGLGDQSKSGILKFLGGGIAALGVSAALFPKEVTNLLKGTTKEVGKLVTSTNTLVEQAAVSQGPYVPKVLLQIGDNEVRDISHLQDGLRENDML